VNSKIVLGATTGTESARANSNFLIGQDEVDGLDPTVSESELDITHCMHVNDITSGIMVLKSFDPSGFTLTQDGTNPSDDRLFQYLAIGDNVMSDHAVMRGVGRGVGRGVM
jgi:hypothetical protein